MIDILSSCKSSRFVIFGVVALLALLSGIAAGSADAQTPGPAAPADLKAYNAQTEGEIVLHWDASEGATHYRVCRRLQDPSVRWGCFDSPDNSALLTRLKVGAVHDFAVAAKDDSFQSSWVSTEALVEVPEVERDPFTGLPIPDGYLSVGEITTHVSGRMFTLTGITLKGGITQGESDFPPLAGRQYVKVCGKVTAPADVEGNFASGNDNNLLTDRGIGLGVPDDNVADWSEVGAVPAGQTRSACDVWEVPAGSKTIIYAVNNWLEDPGVYRVELFADRQKVSRNE